MVLSSLKAINFSETEISNEFDRFYQVTASLSSEYAAEVRDIIINPPAEHPHQCLKRTLIARFSTSPEKRLHLQHILFRLSVGQRTPQFVREMKRLLGKHSDSPCLDD